MQVRDDGLVKMVEKIGEHYKANINNRILRPILLKMELDNTSWDRIDRLTTTNLQGYGYDELYEQILAMAQFIHQAKHRVAPNIRAALQSASPRGARPESPTEKVLREMAVNNFAANLSILADLIMDLFQKTVEIDRRENGEKGAVHGRLPELKQIGQLLT